MPLQVTEYHMFDAARSYDGAGPRLPGPSVGRQRDLSDRQLQRANGLGRVVLKSSDGRTRIDDLFQRSPVRIMFPRSADGGLEETVLINTAGGIAGGDRLEYEISALANASITVTSQAAEKVYRALDEPSRITTKLRAHGSARLAWLPQETIIFNLAKVNRRTEIEVSSGAELLALDWLVLGRAAHGEEMVGGCIRDSWLVKKDGRLIWADTFRAVDDLFSQLYRTALLSDCKAVATLICFGPEPDIRLEVIREVAPRLGCHCAATVVAGLIVVRFAAKASSDLRRAVRDALLQFGPELGGGPFRVPKMWSC
jgi:urease accessory protein